jgi:hypothetical protein
MRHKSMIYRRQPIRTAGYEPQFSVTKHQMTGPLGGRERLRRRPQPTTSCHRQAKGRSRAQGDDLGAARPRRRRTRARLEPMPGVSASTPVSRLAHWVGCLRARGAAPVPASGRARDARPDGGPIVRPGADLAVAHTVGFSKVRATVTPASRGLVRYRGGPRRPRCRARPPRCRAARPSRPAAAPGPLQSRHCRPAHR